MSHPEIDWMVAVERRKDELRAAEQSRLVHLAEANLEESPKNDIRKSWAWTALLNPLVLLMGRFMVDFGIRMSSWGCRLQVRYASLAGNQPAPCD